MSDTREPVVFFYGKLAGATRRDASRLARGAGYRVAEALSSGLDVVVLGEGAPLAQTRERLAEEFDERSKLAFENGTLAIVTETEFLSGLANVEPDETPGRSGDGATPAAVAGVVGVSVATIRRWLRRGLLAPIDPHARLPRLSAREIAVARRLAFLCSGEASEEQVEKRIRAFAQELREKLEARARDPLTEPATKDAIRDDATRYPLFDGNRAPTSPPENAEESAPLELGDVIMSLTLSTDGRELLQYRAIGGDDREIDAEGPTDARGQRFFDFAAYPPDGALDTPDMPARLSPEEEQIALAERLSEWNARTTAGAGTPAILALFPGDAPNDRERRDETTGAAETIPFPGRDAASAALTLYPAPDDVALEPPTQDARVDASLELAKKTPEEEEEQEEEAATTTEFDDEPALEERARAKWRSAASRRQVALCAQAWSYEREGYWEEAVRTYLLAAFAGGADPNVDVCLGKALFLLGDYSAARERFCSALELDPEYGEARVELGRAYSALGDYAEALATFRGALDARPNDPLLRVELGKLYLQQGDHDAAEAEFRRAADHIDDPQLAADVRRLLVSLEARFF